MAGNRTLTRQLLILAALSILSACGGGGGDTPSGPSGGFSQIVIESEELVLIPASQFFPEQCRLRVRIRNVTKSVVNASLFYNAFDASGAGLGSTIVGGNIPPNSSAAFTSQSFVTSGSNPRSLRCSEIARFAIDRRASQVV